MSAFFGAHQVSAPALAYPSLLGAPALPHGDLEIINGADHPTLAGAVGRVASRDFAAASAASPRKSTLINVRRSDAEMMWKEIG
jgi:hypothetical protein